MSLRLRAVLIAGISLAALWLAAAAWMMQGVQTNLDRALDGRLAMSARMVAGLLERGALEPGPAQNGFTDAVNVSGGDGIACEIRSLHGEVLARTTGSPIPDSASLPTGYSEHEAEGIQWRIYVLHTDGYQIMTADQVGQRNVLINELLRAAGIPFLIAVLGGLVALWIGIGRGLAPLQALRQKLANRKTDDTTPIALEHSPAELRPVLDAMNGLLDRLAQTMTGQRAFTDAAAHELRTPLTVIDTHLQIAHITEGAKSRAALRSAEEGVHRLRRTLEQMMTLARTDAPADQEGGADSVVSAVHNVLDQMGGAAHARVKVRIEGDDTATPVPRSMLETAIRNLVENALRYCPEDTAVDVTAAFDPDAPHYRITVADRGPGLAAEQIAQTGRRFWRGDQGRQHKDGAGLGISIVRAIVERFDGTLTLEQRKGGGLSAEIALPGEPRPATATADKPAEHEGEVSVKPES